MAGLDRSAAEFVNRLAQQQPGRLLALVAGMWLLVLPDPGPAVAGRPCRPPATGAPLSLPVLAAIGGLASFGLHPIGRPAETTDPASGVKARAW